MPQGIAIYWISLKTTLIPHSEKNFCIPIGDTFISLKGKKYLELSKGIKNPTPSPPLVIASKIPWETVDKNKTIAKMSFLDLLNKKVSDSLPYAKIYNGGISKEQFTWVEQELVSAKNYNQNVGFYCHFPLSPINNGNLWNTNELLELIEKNK